MEYHFVRRHFQFLVKTDFKFGKTRLKDKYQSIKQQRINSRQLDQTLSQDLKEELNEAQNKLWLY